MRSRRIVTGVLLFLSFSVQGLCQSVRGGPEYLAALPACVAVRGTLESGEVDTYSFQVVEPSLVFITTACVPSSGDTVVLLEDAEGRVLAEDDDAGADYGSSICEFLHSGWYFIVVRRYGDGDPFEYVLRLASSGHSRESEYNGEMWVADPIGTTTGVLAVSGSIESNDVDWYQFDVSVEKEYFIYTYTVPDHDLVIALHDDRGAELARNDGQRDGWSVTTLNERMARGTYYVEVKSRREAGSYTLVVSDQHPEELPDLPLRILELSTEPSLLDKLRVRRVDEAFTIGEREVPCDALKPCRIEGRADYLDPCKDAVAYQAFNLANDGMVLLATLTGFDTELTLFDSNGDCFAMNDDMTADDRRSEIMRFLEDGEYFVLVSWFDEGDTGPYVLYLSTL